MTTFVLEIPSKPEIRKNIWKMELMKCSRCYCMNNKFYCYHSNIVGQRISAWKPVINQQLFRHLLLERKKRIHEAAKNTCLYLQGVLKLIRLISKFGFLATPCIIVIYCWPPLFGVSLNPNEDSWSKSCSSDTYLRSWQDWHNVWVTNQLISERFLAKNHSFLQGDT